MTVKEQLTKLLDDNIQCNGVLGIESCDTCPYRYNNNCYTSAVVDHLLKNSVTIPVKRTEVLEEDLSDGALD